MCPLFKFPTIKEDTNMHVHSKNSSFGYICALDIKHLLLVILQGLLNA